MINVLIIDDEQLFAGAIKRHLEREHYQCSLAATLNEARNYLNSERNEKKGLRPDLILLDMELPDGNGLDFLSEIKDEAPVIIITAYGDIKNAVAAMKNGASDYLKKPIDLKDIGEVVERTLDSRDANNSPEDLHQNSSSPMDWPLLVGKSREINRVRDNIDKITSVTVDVNEGPPTVLILGETGAGKDLTARILHSKSGDPNHPFVQIDCAAIIENEIDTELFGHINSEKATGDANRIGLIEAANKGTIFFNEVGELPLSFQGKLLRVIEHRITRTLGTVKDNKIHARFIASSNRSLADMAKTGEFRADLFYRLNVLTLILPPLRDRIEDISLLSTYFLQKTARRFGTKESTLTKSALQTLEAYQWPGNVRELRYLLERAALMSTNETIDVEDLGLSKHIPKADLRFSTQLGTVPDTTLQETEKNLIENALLRTQGNVSKAARILGITRMTMRYRIKKHGVNPNLHSE